MKKAERELRQKRLLDILNILAGAGTSGLTAYETGARLLPDLKTPLSELVPLLAELKRAGYALDDEGPKGSRWRLTARGIEAQSGTGDRILMTDQTTAAQRQAMTTAKRSANLIAKGIGEGIEALKRGEIPNNDFTASVQRYYRALAELDLLAALGAGTAGLSELADAPEPDTAADGGLAVYPGMREDLAMLLTVARGLGWDSDNLIRLEAAIPPWEDKPAGSEPAAGPVPAEDGS